MAEIPFGTRWLLIRCFQEGEKQFQGIHRLGLELAGRKSFACLVWDGRRRDLSRRRLLRSVLISGHGAEARAAFSCAGGGELGPESLRLPSASGLYLLGCYQGGERQRRAWAEATGVGESRVWGSGGETESFLSTCFLLHLKEDGPESLARWFPLWQQSNDTLRPYFPQARELYRRYGQQALPALEAFFRLYPPTVEVREFLEVCFRHPGYLEGLMVGAQASGSTWASPPALPLLPQETA